jgi:hypothetical protein
MRQALIDSLGHSTQAGFSAGTIMVCVSCGRPIYRFERWASVGAGLKSVREAVAPVAPRDIYELRERHDIDPGTRAQAWEIADVREYCDTIARPKSSDPGACPKCHLAIAQFRSAERSDTVDRAYVWELSTIPPKGITAAPLRGGDLWTPR